MFRMNQKKSYRHVKTQHREARGWPLDSNPCPSCWEATVNHYVVCYLCLNPNICISQTCIRTWDCSCILSSTKRSCRDWTITFVTYVRIFGPTGKATQHIVWSTSSHLLSTTRQIVNNIKYNMFPVPWTPFTSVTWTILIFSSLRMSWWGLVSKIGENSTDLTELSLKETS